MNNEEKFKLVVEEVENQVGLKNNIDYHLGATKKGKYGTYFTLNDYQTNSMLMGIGLWLVKEDGTVYCVEIPVDTELWDDYDNAQPLNEKEENEAMDILGV